MTWAQYNLSDAIPAVIQATTGNKVDDYALVNAGRGQVEVPNDGNSYTHVDYTQIPPVFT